MDFFKVQDGKVEDKPYLSTNLEDSSTSPLGFTHDGKTLYWMDSRESDTTAVVAEDVASGKRTMLAQDARADLGATLRDPASGVVQAYAVEYLSSEWKFLDKTPQGRFRLAAKAAGQGRGLCIEPHPQ